MQDLTQIAIDAALSNNWERAVHLNQAILESDTKDVQALNRLAYAYSQLGKVDKAKKIYHTILALDKYNTIAQKNLEKLSSLPKNKSPYQNKIQIRLSPDLFIEEPGKTKTVVLTHIAPASYLSKLHIGNTVFLYPRKHSIEVRDDNKVYLGALPDDIAFRLMRFLKAGNLYHVCIKNIQKNSISIFIRELKRGNRFRFQPTFIATAGEHSASIISSIKRSDKKDLDEHQDEAYA